MAGSSGGSNVMAIVGPDMWRALHRVAFHYPVRPTDDDRQQAMAFVNSYRGLLPCPRCRRHFGQLIEQTLPPQVDSRDSFSRWTVDAHNAVNQRLGKRLFTFGEACDIYGGCGAHSPPGSPGVDVPVYAASLPGVSQASLTSGDLLYVDRAPAEAPLWATTLPGVDPSPTPNFDTVHTADTADVRALVPISTVIAAPPLATLSISDRADAQEKLSLRPLPLYSSAPTTSVHSSASAAAAGAEKDTSPVFAKPVRGKTTALRPATFAFVLVAIVVGVLGVFLIVSLLRGDGRRDTKADATARESMPVDLAPLS